MPRSAPTSPDACVWLIWLFSKDLGRRSRGEDAAGTRGRGIRARVKPVTPSVKQRLESVGSAHPFGLRWKQIEGSDGKQRSEGTSEKSYFRRQRITWINRLLGLTFHVPCSIQLPNKHWSDGLNMALWLNFVLLPLADFHEWYCLWCLCKAYVLHCTVFLLFIYELLFVVSKSFIRSLTQRKYKYRVQCKGEQKESKEVIKKRKNLSKTKTIQQDIITV